jgi:Protein of unknown function (DUF1569)
MVKTAKVTGRRQLKFSTLDEILADVERLNQGKVRALGNWSPGQNLTHLAIIMNGCLDGIPYQAPFYIQTAGWFLKKRFLKNPMPAGFDLPKAAAAQLVPGDTSWEDGLRQFRTALQRMKTESQRHPHPVLGELTREQWDQLHCRHSELHLSFLIPES